MLNVVVGSKFRDGESLTVWVVKHAVDQVLVTACWQELLNKVTSTCEMPHAWSHTQCRRRRPASAPGAS